MSSSTANQSRVAVVTGGSGGIGRTVAERLAADGMRVVVHYAGNSERAEEAVAAIERAGGTASAVRADVADEREVAPLFDHAPNEYGGVDVVVHTAGVMLLAPLAEFSLDDLDRMHRTDTPWSSSPCRATRPTRRPRAPSTR